MERGWCSVMSPHCVHPAHFPAKYRFDAICPNFSFQLFLFFKWLEFKICKTKGKRKTAAGGKQTKPQSGAGWHSLLSTFSNVFSAVSTQKRFLPYFDVLKREDTWKGRNKNLESAGWVSISPLNVQHDQQQVDTLQFNINLRFVCFLKMEMECKLSLSTLSNPLNFYWSMSPLFYIFRSPHQLLCCPWNQENKFTMLPWEGREQ